MLVLHCKHGLLGISNGVLCWYLLMLPASKAASAAGPCRGQVQLLVTLMVLAVARTTYWSSFVPILCLKGKSPFFSGCCVQLLIDLNLA